MLNLLLASIHISPLSDAEVIFGQGGGAENTKYMIRFTPKMPNTSINQKCSMELGSLHIL